MQRRRILLVLFFLSLAARIPFTAATTDDAFITYRYAENLLAGEGFVYNAGEHILGVTTPLYTLLLALCGLLGLKPMIAGPWLNLFADSLVAPVLSLREKRETGALTFAPVLYALCPLNAFWSASGMETGLFCLTIALAIIAYERERFCACAAASATAFLLRIDAAILVVVLFGHFVLKRRSVPWKPVALFVALCAPWLVFAALYFGNPIPNSLFAKSALAKTGTVEAVVTILARGFLHLRNPAGILLAAAAIYAVLSDKENRLSVATIFAAAYAAAYTLTRSQLHPWYYPPAYVGYLPLAAAGIARFIRRIGLERWQAAAVLVAAVASAAGVAISVRTQLPQEIALDRFLRDTGIAVGRSIPPQSTLFVKDIGYIGYYSRLPIHDFAGLVTPALIPYRATLDFAGGLRAMRSDYAILPGPIGSMLEANTWFRDSYEVQEIFSSGGQRMVLYRRR